MDALHILQMMALEIRAPHLADRERDVFDNVLFECYVKLLLLFEI